MFSSCSFVCEQDSLKITELIFLVGQWDVDLKEKPLHFGEDLDKEADPGMT